METKSIDSSLNSLRYVINETHDYMSQLEAKLERICVTNPVVEAKTSKCAYKCKLAAEVEEATDSVSAIRNRIRELLERVEL